MPVYDVKFPDGHVQTFSGPPNLSDADAYTRAVQERSIAEGKIPTTFAAGAAPEASQSLATAGLSAAGYATGNPGLIAAAPAVGRAARAVAEKVTGQNVTPTNTAEVATLAAEGAIPAFAPGIVSGIARPMAAAVSKLPVSSLPQALAKGAVPAAEELASKADAISPKAVSSILDSLVTAAKKAGARIIAGVSTEDIELLRKQISTGMAPRTAAKIIAGSDPQKAASLLRIMRMP